MVDDASIFMFENGREGIFFFNLVFYAEYIIYIKFKECSDSVFLLTITVL